MTLVVGNLSVSLRRREVLRGISFEAKRGELLVIVGPNGAGKTTLLKAIGGLIAAQGLLEWDGKALAKLPASDRARLLAYLPQGHIAHWPLMARDVVTIGRNPFASNLDRLPREDNDAVDRALEAVNALDLADRPVTELSGGERARIMLARALAARGPMLLADEPVASLDPAHQLGVMKILASEAKNGRLVIAVSHDLILGARFADRVLVLSDGRMAGLGWPRQTLTASLLRDVFQVEPLRLSAKGVQLEIPWEPLPG